MSALKEYYEELVGLYGFACEAGAAFHQWQTHLQSKVVDNSNTNPRNKMFFGRQDPNDADAQHQYSITFGELITRAQKDGRNQMLIRRMVITLSFALWEDEYRGKIAVECGLSDRNEVKSDVFYDLNKYRQAILHASGRLDREPKALDFFKKGETVEISEAQIYGLIKVLVDELNRISEVYYQEKGEFSLDRGFS